MAQTERAVIDHKGLPVDGTEFDRAFNCNCSETNYDGPNCQWCMSESVWERALLGHTSNCTVALIATPFGHHTAQAAAAAAAAAAALEAGVVGGGGGKERGWQPTLASAVNGAAVGHPNPLGARAADVNCDFIRCFNNTTR